jgi:hypothetical protein
VVYIGSVGMLDVEAKRWSEWWMKLYCNLCNKMPKSGDLRPVLRPAPLHQFQRAVGPLQVLPPRGFRPDAGRAGEPAPAAARLLFLTCRLNKKILYIFELYGQETYSTEDPLEEMKSFEE